MKAYLIITGIIFAMIAMVHVVRTVAEWQRLAAEPWFYLEGPGLAAFSAALCVWAYVLLRASTRRRPG